MKTRPQRVDAAAVRKPDGLRRAGGARQVNARRQEAMKRRTPWTVVEDDLEQLDDIRELLHALNDAYASTQRIEELVSKIPILSARCIRRARKRSPGRDEWTVGQALTLVGNIGLESELLELLEDLTTLRADLAERA